MLTTRCCRPSGACEVEVSGRVYRIELDEAPYSYELVVTRNEQPLGLTFPRRAGDSESRGVINLLLADLRQDD